ncbi:hypothetical protein E4K66_22515 [Bradyrhizobium frederickii]|uniref:Uncharacterized protein n=1 Tax=Bradyrhizobium frederickii TaxID=2560054 RepID=A0A4Y9KZM7_9BRAD|nr:hypothetical protein E4K66_22515 [Bradyrhizobium frederickii]
MHEDVEHRLAQAVRRRADVARGRRGEIAPLQATADDAHYTTPSCPGLSRASTFFSRRRKQDVDGRVKPGHDDLLRSVGIAPSIEAYSPSRGVRSRLP